MIGNRMEAMEAIANFFAMGGDGAFVWPAFVVAAAVMVALLLVTTPIRLLIPNITGFLALTIPIAMSIGTITGLNPIVCGLLAMIVGDAVLYYPAQSASSLVVYERGHLSAAEIFRFGLLMTGVAYIVVLLVALPYWAAVGEPLRLPSGR